MASQRLTQASDFPYSTLDEARNEIRVLNLQTIERPPLVNLRDEPPEWHGLVHCTIEHVSLDAHLSGYQQWVSKAQPLSRRNSDGRWRLFSNERYRSLSPTRVSSPFERPRTHHRYHRFEWGDYGALSYTWGDQTIRVPIVMNGQIVLIGQSLEAALRALSSDPDYIEGLKIWADAICINQKDLDERSLQVKRMRMIYGKALIVSIWLGAVPDAAVPDMAQLHEIIVKSTDNDAAFDLLEIALTDPEKRETIRRAIDVIVKKTYWTRIWVIQEKCLGPVNPSILFGTFRMGLMPLHNFLQAATNIQGAVRAREKVWRVLKLVELMTINQERIRRRHPPTDKERRRDQDELGLLLMIGRMARSLDLRDRLYGLMGMIPEYVAKHIEPDYKKAVEEVFYDFAKALITGFGSFDIVLTGTTESTLTLPSWVPDLTSPWDPYLWGSDCDASWGQDAWFGFEQDKNILVTSGYFVDIVDGIAPFLGWEHGELRIWQDAIHPTSKAIPDNPKAAILRTLHRAAVYDCSTGYTILDIPWLEDLKPDNPDVMALEKRGWGKVLKHANLQDLIQFRNQINAQFKPWGQELKSFFPRPEDVGECQDPKRYLDSLDKHVGIVYPIFTTAGGLFGTAILQVLKKGDSIFVVPGCSAPLIMRQKGNQWQVITQCFVDGLMRGETGRRVEQGTCKLNKLLIV